MNNNKWSGRAFVSLCSLVSFILLGLTGIVLFIQPHGRVAYWTNWNLLGLEKDQFGNIHLLAALLFLVIGGFHLYFNWKPLIRYLSGKIENTLRHTRELVISGLILLWILVSGIWALPPLIYVADLGEAIKNSWVISPKLEPPFGHAELVSLKTFCKKQQIPLDQAMMELRNAGFTVKNPKTTLAEIADSMNTSGMGVYEVIKKLEAKPEAIKPGVVWTPDMVEETFSGTGLGRKTVGQVITELGLDAEMVFQRLKEANIEAKDDDRFKKLANDNDTTPIKVLTIILVEKS